MPARFPSLPACGLAVATVIAAMTSVAWASTEDDPEAAAAAPPTGSLHGLTRHAGSNPLRVKTLTNSVDVETCGERVRPRSLITGPRRSLGNVFVELRAADGSLLDRAPWDPAAEPVPLRLVRCAAEPHVLVVPAGSALEIVNSDHLRHELVTNAVVNPVLDRVLPRYRRRIHVESRYVGQPELLRLSCRRHAFMTAWWVVTDNARHVVTESDGAFRFDDLAPGTYQVRAWHQAFGRLEERVTVEEGGAVRLELEFR